MQTTASSSSSFQQNAARTHRFANQFRERVPVFNRGALSFPDPIDSHPASSSPGIHQHISCRTRSQTAESQPRFPTNAPLSHASAIRGRAFRSGLRDCGCCCAQGRWRPARKSRNQPLTKNSARKLTTKATMPRTQPMTSPPTTSSLVDLAWMMPPPLMLESVLVRSQWWWWWW